MSEIYRWAVVDKDVTIITHGTIFKKKQDAVRALAGLRRLSMRSFAGHRVVKFQLVECAEGEGNGE